MLKIEYNKIEATTKEEFNKIKKEYVKGEKYTLEKYKDFKAALLGFWTNYTVSGTETATTTNKVKYIELKFFGEGLTDALVFRAEVFFNTGKNKIRVMKYDTVDNIRTETELYDITGDCRDAILFPGLKNNLDEHSNNGKAFLCMRSVIDSAGASSSHTLIQYILEKYGQNNDYLKLYGEKISQSLGRVYNGMSDDFYFLYSETSLITNKTLYDYFCEKETGKINLEVLNQKTKNQFSETYDRCKTELEGVPGHKLPEACDFFNGMDDAVKNTPVMLTTHAIHGDFNPNNILMAISDDGDGGETIFPMVIDFMEVKLRKNNEWVPLFYDPARLEAELVIRYFYKLKKKDENNELTKELWDGMKQVLESLHNGQFLEIISPDPNNQITDNELNYIFRIIYHFRAKIFAVLDVRAKKYDRKKSIINYTWCVMAFCYFYLKFEQEENIQDKKKLALAMANFYRENLPRLLKVKVKDVTNYYRKTRMQTLNLLLIQRTIEQCTENYVDIEKEVNKVINFVLHKDNKHKHLLITGNPGTGKTSLSSYLTRLLNGDINLPKYLEERKNKLDKIFCIPYFSGKMKYVRIIKEKDDFEKESGEYDALTWFSEKLVSLFPELAEEKPPQRSLHSLNSGPNLLERFRLMLQNASLNLLKRDKRIIFLIDGLDVYSGSIDEFLIAESYPCISFVYTSRPDKEQITNKIKKLPQYADPIELVFFKENDLNRYLERIGLKLEEDVVTLLFKKSNGWQIYINKVCGILADTNNDKRLEILQSFESDTIDEIYEYIIKTKITDVSGNDNKKAAFAVLFTLAQAREPLNTYQLCFINRDYLKDVVNMETAIEKGLIMCQQLLRQTETRAYTFFHETARTFVMENYPFTLNNEHRKIFANCLQKTLIQPERNALFDYALRNAGIHLYEWGMEDRLIKLLNNIYADKTRENDADEILDKLLEQNIREAESPEDSKLETLIENVMEKLPSGKMRDLLMNISDKLYYRHNTALMIYLGDFIIRLSEKIYDKSKNDYDLEKLADAYGRHGKSFVMLQNNWTEAMVNLKKSLELSEELNIRNAKNKDYDPKLKESLAISYANLGDCLKMQGNAPAAIAAYTKAIILKKDIKHQYEKHGITHIISKIVYIFLKIIPATWNSYFKKCELANKETRECKDYPPELQVSLANTYISRVDCYLSPSEQALSLAMKDCERGIKLFEDIEDRYKNKKIKDCNISWLVALASSYLSRCMILAYDTKLTSAIKDSERAITLMKYLKDEYKKKFLWPPVWDKILASSYSIRGELWREQSRLNAPLDYDADIVIEGIKEQDEAVTLWQDELDKAIKNYNEAINLFENIKHYRPSWQLDLVICYTNRGRALASQKKDDFTDAIKDYERAIILGEHLKDRYKEIKDCNPEYLAKVALAYIDLGNVLQYQKNMKNAFENYIAAIDLREEILSMGYTTIIKELVTDYYNLVNLVDSEELPEDIDASMLLKRAAYFLNRFSQMGERARKDGYICEWQEKIDELADLLEKIYMENK